MDSPISFPFKNQKNQKMLKLIKYHPLFAYSVGDEFEVSQEDAQKLLEGEYAVEIGATNSEKATDKSATDSEKATRKGKHS